MKSTEKYDFARSDERGDVTGHISRRQSSSPIPGFRGTLIPWNSRARMERGPFGDITNPLGQSLSHFVDGAGRMLSLTNSIGLTARIEYDALNQPTRVTDPLQGVTSFGYDPNGNLFSVTDAGLFGGD